MASPYLKTVKGMLSLIFAGAAAPSQTKEKKPSASPPSFPAPIKTATEGDTLSYQLDLILDDLMELETVHLPQKGRIKGTPCDCLLKHSRNLKRHALETIPIAARQGISPKLFSNIASWAEEIMKIGRVEDVASGKYDERYLEEAGKASLFRKELEKLKGECDTCPQLTALKEFLRRRKEGV